MKTKLSMVVLGMLATIGTASADPILCSNTADGSSATQTLSGLSTGDVTLNGSDANDCWGIVSGNDTTANAWDGSLTLYELAQWDQGTPDVYVGGSIGDVNFWLTDVTAGTSGSFTLNWEDTGAADPNYDFTTDLIFTTKSGPNFASYLFDTVAFIADGTSAGTYEITYKNNGNNIGAISHLAVYHTGYTTTSTSSTGGSAEIPEPGNLTLLGVAMLGGLLVWRRRRNSV